MLPHRLICLGTPQLLGPDGDPVRLRTRKHMALLVFLAVEADFPHRRDRLGTMLWPGVDIEEARHSLATALSALRGRLGAGVFEADRDTVSLTPGFLEADVTALINGDLLELEAMPLGPFLDEWNLDEACDFQHWVDGMRAHLLPMIHEQLLNRIDHARRTGNSRHLERLSERLQRLDSCSEEAARAMVEARALAGDRIGALRCFESWRIRLAEELGAMPSPELTQMADRLRRHGLTRSAGSVSLPPVPTEQWQERLFAGRAAEFQICYEIWQKVHAGGPPAHVLLSGVSGIGKTTLAGRVATSIALEGASVARVPCYALERELPFGVVGHLVSHLLDLPGAATTPPEQLAELGRLVPRVRERWPGLPAPLAIVGESARIQFTEAVMALIAALAEEHPVMLVIDDIHLADATSLAVLHLIIRRVRELPFMVILTHTSDSTDATPSARRFIDHPSDLRLTPVTLGPLTPGVTNELLDHLTQPDEVGPSVRRALIAGAGGNPMILELLMADWRRRGENSFALSIGAMTSDAERPPAEAFRQLVDGVLGSLDREARAVADLGAILGKRLNDLSMYSLVDMPVTRTMRAMTSLTSQRVLRDAGSHLEFANELVRGQCYIGMAAPMRRLLHSMVADRLVAHDSGLEAIPGLEIAWHLVRGDRLEEAVPYLLRGGRESIRRGAPHEAEMALFTGLPALTGDSRRTATLLLTEAMQELGRWPESLEVLEKIEEPLSESERCWREVLRLMAKRWTGQVGVGELVESSQALIQLSGREIDVEVRVKALSTIPYLLSQTQDEETVRNLGRALLNLESVPKDGYQTVHYLMAKAYWRASQGNQRAALKELATAVQIIDNDEIGSTIAVRVFNGQGVMHLLAGRYADALAPLQRAIMMAQRLDNPLLQCSAAASLAIAHGRMGDFSAQLQWSGRALACLPTDDCSILALSATYENGLALVFSGRDSDAISLAATFDQRCPKTSPEWVRQAAFVMKADIYALAGDDRKAFKAARSANALGNGSPLVRDFAGPMARWSALLAMKEKKLEETLARLIAQSKVTKDLHAKDRAEISVSIAMLQERAGVTPDWESAKRQLRQLPTQITAVVRRLGMLRDRNAPGNWGIGGPRR